MICPKCGFNQPEDIYCARCGVHVKKYRQKRKKKTLIVFLSVLIILAGAALLTGRIYSVREAQVAIVQSPSPAVTLPEKPHQVTIPKRTSSSPKRLSSAGREGPEEKGSVTSTEPRTAAKPQSPATETPSKKEGSGQTAEKKGTVLTALQWFNRGTALNDDSDEEINCYQRALELDPGLAPAYYRLGAIYFRNAEYELADLAFARFLKFATDEQKGIYDIYIFYSPREVENLGVEEEGPPESAVAAKKQAPDQEKPGSTAQGENRETKSDHSKELQTAIPFESMGDHIIVPVRLNGAITARMLLDTGAGITVISTPLAEELHLNLDGARTILLKTLTREVCTPLARLPRLQLGSHTKENFLVAICAMSPVRDSFEGILGMDFLKGLTITVNAAEKTISLRACAKIN